MPDDTTSVGESVEIALVRYFSDPDGDALAYAAGSSDEGVAAVGVADVTLRVASVGQGVATVTVTATDLGGLSAEQSFTVTVPNRAPEVSYPIPDAQVYVAEVPSSSPSRTTSPTRTATTSPTRQPPPTRGWPLPLRREPP